MEQKAHSPKHQVPLGRLRASNRREGAEGYRPNVIPLAAKQLFGGIQMNENVQEQATVKSPVKNKIGSVFIPVRDIERARDWYCTLLGLSAENCHIMSGHLCPLPMEGTGIILDTMPGWGGQEPGGAPHITTPAFMFLTNDLQASYAYCRQIDVTLVTEIEHDHWFVIQDPDGNKLMVCRE